MPCHPSWAALIVLLTPALAQAVEPTPARAPVQPAPYASAPPASAASAPAPVQPAPHAAYAPAVPPPPYMAPPPPGTTVTVDNWPGMARTGMGLTIAGLATGAVGGALFGASLAMDSSDESSMAPVLGAFGLVLFIPAGGLTLTGIPLWIAGEVDVDVPPDDPRVYEQRRARVDLTLAPGGAALVGHF